MARRVAGAAARAVLFPELFFAMYFNVVYLKGIRDLTLARQASGSTSSSPTRAKVEV